MLQIPDPLTLSLSCSIHCIHHGGKTKQTPRIAKQFPRAAEEAKNYRNSSEVFHMHRVLRVSEASDALRVDRSEKGYKMVEV